ncbi:unnamed protein product [Musa textilis]
MSTLSLPSMESHDLFETGGNRGLPIDAIGKIFKDNVDAAGEKGCYPVSLQVDSSVDKLSMHRN